MKVSIDGGLTWIESDGVRVMQDDVDEEGSSVLINCTYEGIIVDALDREGESLGMDSETYNEIFNALAIL